MSDRVVTTRRLHRRRGPAARTRIAPTYYPGTTDESDARTISVRSGRNVTNIVVGIAAMHTFQVSGVVTDENNDPIANTTVLLNPDLRSVSWVAVVLGVHESARSDANGSFTFRDIPAGSYAVSVQSADDDN